jgi:histone-lysine N-methyltransferase SETMAR
MSEISPFIRSCLLYEFDLGHTSYAAHQNIARLYPREAPTQRTCYKWFDRFAQGNRSLEDKERSGRPAEVDREALETLITENRRMTTRELAEELGCHHSTVAQILHDLGYKIKLGAWIPHHLTPAQRENRISICSSHLSHYPLNNFLRQIITGDEKWVLYTHHTRKRQWVREAEEPERDPKSDPHEKKQMLSIWWDIAGIIYWELLPPSTTVTATLYCNQLDKLRKVLTEVRPRWVDERGKVRLLHDNAKPHVAKVTRKKLEKLRWQVLAHPPYSPDLSPSDYHLFRALSNFLKEKKYDDQEHMKNDLRSFFASLSPDFFIKGIMDLPHRWETVIDTNGDYIKD